MVTIHHLHRIPKHDQDACPRARILIMLRNPVEVMYSYHSTNLAEGFETIPDFEKALVAEEKRRRGLRVPAVNSGILENLFYRDVVRYARQVEKYLHAFEAENVLVLIYDDFK